MKIVRTFTQLPSYDENIQQVNEKTCHEILHPSECYSQFRLNLFNCTVFGLENLSKELKENLMTRTMRAVVVHVLLLALGFSKGINIIPGKACGLQGSYLLKLLFTKLSTVIHNIIQY